MARGLGGVLDDLSELGRHLLDIACFVPLLSPTHTDSPPHTPRFSLTRPRRRSPSPLPPSPPILSGILSDLVEIGGALRGGLSRLSVSLRPLPESPTETAAILSLTNPHPLSPPRDAVGVSDDLVDFVEILARCPDSWVEFPVPTGDGKIYSVLVNVLEHILNSGVIWDIMFLIEKVFDVSLLNLHIFD
jgi:hypothetical protein